MILFGLTSDFSFPCNINLKKLYKMMNEKMTAMRQEYNNHCSLFKVILFYLFFDQSGQSPDINTIY